MSSPSPRAGSRQTGSVEGSRTRAFPVARAVWWVLPVLFLLWLYREGFSAWFVADDFAWLSLLRLVHARHDLLHELFAPMAQGTIRPWSERGYFMLLQSLFGLDSLPFRLVAFVTAAADAILIAWITRRATASRVAGVMAPILWIANTALVRPMTWSSSYNELMCTLFLLGALALFIRYSETGRRKFWWWQVVVFGLGFGALEVNIVYPALAAAWLLFVKSHEGDARGHLRRAFLTDILPLATISIVYFIAHRLAAPIPATGVYKLHFDLSILKNLALYWKWSLAPEPMDRFGHRRITATLVSLTGTIAIIAFAAAELRRHRITIVFFLAWFVITLAPMILLSDHRTDYYVTIPVIGIAMLGGAAAGLYWNSPFVQRALMVIPLGVYLWAMIPVSRGVTHWWVSKSLGVRTLVLGVTAGRQTHPGKAIVLEGVKTELFDLSLANSPFEATGTNDVYLTPESALTLHPAAGMAPFKSLVPEPEALWHGITHDEVVVYSFESDHLRNITEGYTRRMADRNVDRLPSALPSRVDVGDILYSWLLGPTWLPPEGGIRWMSGSATLRIGVPEGGSRLELDGQCPEAELLASPRHLMVLVDGIVAGDTRIYDPETTFQRLFPVPALLAGKKTVDVEIRVDPVDRKDGQDYGLVFGNIAVLP